MLNYINFIKDKSIFFLTIKMKKDKIKLKNLKSIS